MRIRKLIVSGLLVLLFVPAHAIDFSRVDLSWQYDPQAAIKVAHRVVQQDGSLTIFLRLAADSVAQWKVELFTQPQYESETHQSLTNFVADTITTDRNRVIVSLKFAKPEDNLLVAKLMSSKGLHYYDIPLRNGTLPFSSIYPADSKGVPIFGSYVKATDFQLRGSSGYHVLQYRENFDLADPPMADMKALAPSIFPDSSFQYSSSSQLIDDYFYVIREDSNASTGITLLKTPPYYPQQKLIPELCASMRYILNEPERKGLQNSTNLRETFDAFWLKTFITKFRARNAIRKYYNWVEEANRHFTDFKEGWKTDRGMIYIVFGAPDEVYRTNSAEEWYYDRGPGFEFTVISTFFSPRTYSLRRSLEHQSSWFDYIATLRRGTNE